MDRSFETARVNKSFVQRKRGKRTGMHCYSQTNLYFKVRLASSEDGASGDKN